MRDGTFNGITLLLCTDSYSIKEVVILMNVLMIRYNIYCNIHSYNNRYPKIYIYIKDMDKLGKAVKPYTHESMRYKLE
jgi:LAGLIDADG DNA endonuclease family protein